MPTLTSARTTSQVYLPAIFPSPRGHGEGRQSGYGSWGLIPHWQAVFRLQEVWSATFRYTGIESREGMSHYGLNDTVAARDER